MKIAIASDHRGFKTKSSIIKFLRKKGHRVVNYGTDSENSVDYPDFAFKVSQAVVKKKVRFGVLLCYTGQGMAMSANKVKGVRAAICISPEIAKLTRAHNNANILVIPAGFMKYSKTMQKTIDVFMYTKFEGGRHLRRLKKILNYESDNQ